MINNKKLVITSSTPSYTLGVGDHVTVKSTATTGIIEVCLSTEKIIVYDRKGGKKIGRFTSKQLIKNE